MTDLMNEPDGRCRPSWALVDRASQAYYDEEWGLPVRDERGVFQALALESFQAGLSWALVLKRRDAFLRAFHDFDPDVVAAFTPADVEMLAADDSIIRNRAKIRATINNASKTLELRQDVPLHELVWSYEPAVQPAPICQAEIVLRPESIALAKDLKQRGFQFVGPTSAQSLLEAIGVINHHIVGSHRRPLA